LASAGGICGWAAAQVSPAEFFFGTRPLAGFCARSLTVFGDGSGASYGFFSLLGKYFLKKSEKL